MFPRPRAAARRIPSQCSCLLERELLPTELQHRADGVSAEGGLEGKASLRELRSQRCF